MKNLYRMSLMIALMIALFLAASVLPRAAEAQGQNVTLHTLLERLRDSGTPVTLEFVKPLVTGEATWTLPDASSGRSIGEVGEDYVCFSEPWNDTTRDRCTPFSNIIGVSFVR